jgi:DNA-binding transcriptional MocR family regulator
MVDRSKWKPVDHIGDVAERGGIQNGVDGRAIVKAALVPAPHLVHLIDGIAQRAFVGHVAKTPPLIPPDRMVKLVGTRANLEVNVTTSLRRREVLDLPLPLDHTAGNQSLQVHASLRAAILGGRLAPGTRLPSSRELAEQLGVGRNAVVIAYEHLQGDGLVETRQGAGTYVAMLPEVGSQSADVDTLEIETPPRGRLAIGRTYGDPALLQRLASAIRRRIVMASQAELGYGDPRGSLDLRNQLAAHLAATRGILCDPACMLITSGTQQGLRLCIDALLQPGDSVWMEDPGYPTARRTLQTTVMRVVPVPVDAEVSKTLFPALRLAYVVLPRAIVGVVLRARGAQDRVPQLFTADAVADLMVDGTIAAHIRRMRRRYRMGRDALVAALEAAGGATLRVIVPTQGLHLLALLPPGLPSDAAAEIRDTASVDT